MLELTARLLLAAADADEASGGGPGFPSFLPPLDVVLAVVGRDTGVELRED